MISGKSCWWTISPPQLRHPCVLENFVPRQQILYASTAAQAIQILDSTPLAVAFLDIDMPDTKNFSLARYIDEHHKGLPYVFFDRLCQLCCGKLRLRALGLFNQTH